MPKKQTWPLFCQHILTWEIKAAVKRWKKASPLQRPAVFHYYQTPILSPVFLKKDEDIPANRKKKLTINLWESQKAKNYKHSKLALPARQQQLETQFQRKFREIIFTKNFVKISRQLKIYVWVSRDDVRSCSTEFFKTEKEKEGRGGNEIFWWTPFLSQFPKAHLEFHAYVSRKKAPKYAFFSSSSVETIGSYFFEGKNPKADWCRLRVSSGRFLLLTTTSTTTTAPAMPQPCACFYNKPTYISIWPSGLGKLVRPRLYTFFFLGKNRKLQ